MRYMGGKQRISKQLSAFIQGEIDRLNVDTFVDLFCGSCNVVSNVNAKYRYANDIHPQLIAMWKALQTGWMPPKEVNEYQYDLAKDGKLSPHETAFIGFGCSYSGKYFGGYARSGNRNYALNARNSCLKKIDKIKDVSFFSMNYSDFCLPSSGIVYCDIPYRDTAQYKGVPKFNHDKFYAWAQKCKIPIYVSEYKENVPFGWKTVFEIESKQDMHSKSGKAKTTEVLITPYN